MSLKLKRVLFILISVLLVSSVSLCFMLTGNNNSVNVNAQTIETTIQDVKSVYTLNAIEEFPTSVNVSYAGDEVTAEKGVVIYPNGSVYNIEEGKSFNLSIMGTYTLKYYYTSSDSTLYVVNSFEVNDNLYNLSYVEGDGTEMIAVFGEEITAKYKAFEDSANWPAEYQGLTKYEFYRELFIKMNEGNTGEMFDKFTKTGADVHSYDRYRRIIAGHFYEEFFNVEENVDIGYVNSHSNVPTTNHSAHPDDDALILRLAPGAKFTLSEPINLNAGGDSVYPEYTSVIKLDPRLIDVADNNGTIYKNAQGKVDTEAISKFTSYATGVTITLTDCYDPTNYVKLTSETKNNNWYSFMASTDSLPAVHLTKQKMKEDATRKNLYYGEEVWTAVKGQCYTDTNYYWTYENYRQSAEILYDSNTGRFYVGIVVEDGYSISRPNVRMFADLHNKEIYDLLGAQYTYRPFTTGEVYVSIECYDYVSAAPARVDVMSIGHIDNETLCNAHPDNEVYVPYKDIVSPVIKVDAKYTNEEEQTVFCAVGDVFEVPKATAYDVNLVGGVETTIYRNYGKSNQTIVSSIDGKFTPTLPDTYTIVYSAVDGSGNSAKEIIYVKCSITEDGKTINFDEGTHLSNVKVMDGTVKFPDFSISTLNNAADIKVNIDITRGSETFYSWQLKNGAEITEFLNADNYLLFEDGGEYTVTYKFADNFVNSFSTPVSYNFNVIGNDIVGIENNVFIQRLLIKNATYALQNLNVYSYESGHRTIIGIAEPYIIFDGGEPVKIEDIQSVTITGSSTAQLMYTYGDVAPVYSEVSKIKDVNYGNKKDLTMQNYFDYEDGAFTIDTAPNPNTGAPARNMLFMSTATSGNAKISFANAVNYESLLVAFKIQEEFCNFKKMNIILTDPYNTDNSHVLSFYQQDGKTMFSVNGETTYTLTVPFASANALQIGWTKVSNMLTVSGYTGRILFNFNFTSYLTYVDYEIEDIYGDAGVLVTKINKQNISLTAIDNIAPEVVHDRELGKFSLGEVVTINSTYLTDVLSIPAKEKISVSFVYDGETLVAEDGTKLNGVDNNPYQSYNVKLDKGIGSYEIQILAFDGHNNKLNYKIFLSVGDWTPPEVTFNGEIKENVLVSIKAGTTINVDYSVSDDLTPTENIRHMIIVENLTHNIMYTYLTKEITFTDKGEFDAYVCAYDDEGNYVRKYFKVVVS